VALRSMRTPTVAIIEPDPVFAWYRGDRRGGIAEGVEPARTAEFQRLFRDLRKAGVGPARPAPRLVLHRRERPEHRRPGAAHP
jgi:hypothetical protein